ncbi:MAG: penicillin-insensitive murein endopeptidase [Rhodospirillaceae bacterium]
MTRAAKTNYARWTALCLATLAWWLGPAGVARAEDNQRVAWHLVRTPSPGHTKVIGGYAHGCLAGGMAIPLEGTGYQIMRTARRRYFGHPSLIDYLQGLGKRAASAGIGIVAIGDLSQPRGGPTDFGHASHQNGLDVDIWLRLDLPELPRERRDTLKEVTVMNRDTLRLTRPAWSAAQATLIKLAAKDPRVSRLFVNPAIKIELCKQAGNDREWLHKVRPWYGHDDHLHVRLSCPADSPQCEPQRALPPGEGCDSELESWLSAARPADPNKKRVSRRPPNPTLPQACYHLNLAAGEGRNTVE